MTSHTRGSHSSARTPTTDRMSAATSTRTRERLRDLEEELERARREATPPASTRTSPVTTTRTRERLSEVEEELERVRLGPRGPDTPPASAYTSPVTTTRTRERLREVEEELGRARRGGAGAARPSTGSPTSTRTREKLREAEALISRLKREGEAAAPSPADASRRLRDLKRDESAAASRAPRRSTAGLLKAVCSTDLLFLMDTTASMSSYIEAAKNQVRSIVSDIGTAFYNEAEVRIAVVSYKDHEDRPNIQFLDFTTSVSAVHSFLDGLAASGGGDTPEDVLGGLRQALDASWKHQTRCIIHIADAPPHGRTLHDLGDSADTYATPGSEPHGLTHQSLLPRLVSLHINYALLRINNSTDRMAYTFLQAYGAAAVDGSLLPTNKYSGYMASGSRRGAARGLLFREAELGTTFAALRHLVVKAVTASASRTAVRHVTWLTKTASVMGPSPGLAPIAELSSADSSATDVPLDSSPPRWDSPSWFDETLVVQGFSLEAIMHGATTLDDMMASDDNILMSVLNLTIRKRKTPFAQGALRLAFHARTSFSTNNYVVKTSKRRGELLPLFTEDMRCQALCKSFALEFNSLLDGEHTIDFLATACFKGNSSSTDATTCISLEPFLEGTYVKYNGNAGYVEDRPDDPVNRACQAFSHFTFERSKGQFLVCDLQGVGKFLTDPVIHTADDNRFKLSRTNLGLEGMKLFFASHECNDECRRLGLRSSQATLASGTRVFREAWPTMADVVCCSNKMCERILRRAEANAPERFPGYHWCDVCLPQLEAFTVKWSCVEPGPTHDFEVSRFFYESQGLPTPRKCPRHREAGALTAARSATRTSSRSDTVLDTMADRTIASTRVADGLWSSLRSATEIA
ncbi:hypothetical protein DL770_003538 [Monosporascus sp. CRB-9-2]|nr:hypothetical protein DL770_003538 [Monosporascus sp. CRB-9-2]